MVAKALIGLVWDFEIDHSAMKYSEAILDIPVVDVLFSLQNHSNQKGGEPCKHIA